MKRAEASEEHATTRRRAVEYVGVFGLHSILTFCMTYPAVWVVRDNLIGIPRGDKFQFVWIFWWVKRALLELHQLPSFTLLQYHPTGVSLAMHDMSYFWSLLSVPLQLALDPRLVLNLFLLLCFPLNGICFYHLARVVTGSRLGSLVGSVVFAFCPYFLGRFYVSHIQYLGAFFIPLFVLCLWRYERERKGRHLLAAGLVLGLQSLITFYYGVALAYLLLAFLLRCGLREVRRGEPEHWRRFVSHVAGLVLVTSLLVAPVAVPMLVELHGAQASPEAVWLREENIAFNSADLMAYLVPDHSMAAWRGWQLGENADALRRRLASQLHGSYFERSVYPGYLSWIALLCVLSSAELRRRYRVFVWLMLGFMVFGLGPSLYVGGRMIASEILPAALASYLPGMNLVRSATRYSCLAMLGAGVLVAAWIGWIQQQRGRRVAGAAASAALIVACLEFLPRPVTFFPFSTWLSPVNLTIREDPREISVLNIPVDFRDPRGGGDLYEYAQTVHHKPIIGGYVSREPESVFAPLNESPFLQALQQREYDKDPRLLLGDAGRADLDASLMRLGVGYVLVHRQLLPGDEWQRVIEWLTPGLGSPIHEDRWVRAYRYPPIETAADATDPSLSRSSD